MDVENAFERCLTAALSDFDVALTPEQTARLVGHYRAMVEANRRMNLTRITEPAEAAVKHYADSLALAAWLKAHWNAIAAASAAPSQPPWPATILDVGCGAGFPAFPLAVALRACRVTAIDGTGKKIEFLRQAAQDLGVENLEAVHARAEHWRPGRAFELAAARAVAPLDRLLTWTRHLVAPSGRLLAYKSAALDADELRASARAAPRCGFAAETVFPYVLRCGRETLSRALHVYRKRMEPAR